MIIIRADASSSIGTGHIMRDLVLAKNLQVQYKEDIYFATQLLQGNLNNKIVEEGFEIISLHSNDINEFLFILKDKQPSMVVIDHYQIGIKEEKLIKNTINTKLMIVDDLYDTHFCDILLNHNICADESRYKNIIPEHCELRCGKDYTLIRDEFIIAKEMTKKIFNTNNMNIFIAMGGADHSNINLNILHALKPYKNIHINLVTTTANGNLNELENYCKDKKHITLYINTNHIANLMISSDFVIISPSVIANETLFLGLPLIAIKTAENQEDMYNYLVQNNFISLKTFDEQELQKAVEDMICKLS